MEKKYEVNRNTLAVIGMANGKSKIIEYDSEFLIDRSSYHIMEDSCKYFGSSYQGRVDGSKQLLGTIYKVPVIVEESAELVFFPIGSPTSKLCSWFALDSIKKFTQEKSKTKIVLVNDKKYLSTINTRKLDNQILRASRLKYLLNDRKVVKK